MKTSKWLLLALLLTLSVFLVSTGDVGAAVDGGYVGSQACQSCHTGIYGDFIKSGHPWKYKHTGGTTPPNAWDPLSSLFPRPKGVDIDTATLGEDCGNGLVVCDVNGDLDWAAINYTVGGYGWKIRWGVRDSVNPAGTANRTGYVWTAGSSPTSAQYNIENNTWSAYNGNKDKKYECATCHNTNGRILTAGYDCAKTTTYDAVTNPGVEPWASNTDLALNPTDAKGGYYSEWSLDGVQCEACHGAGDNHVNGLGGPTKSNIKRNGVNCGLCHLRAENTVKFGTVSNAECGGPNAGPDVYSYKVNGAKSAADYINHHEQYNELVGVNGDGAMAHMSCTDCHDPHKRVHKVVDSVATALGITDNNLSAEARGAVVKCENCHGAMKIKYDMGAIKCIDCHMGEATKSATATTGTWGRKGDVKTHIFKINPSSDANTRTNSEGVTVAANYITVRYACGKCHDSSIGGTATALDLAGAQAAAVDMHLLTSASAPTAAFTDSASMYTVTLVDGSTAGSALAVKWGDGSSSTGSAGATLQHTYATAGTFNIMLTATKGGLSDSATGSVSVPEKFDITVNLSAAVGTDPITTNAKFILKKNGITRAVIKATDTATFSNRKPGNYKVKMYKKGYTFTCTSTQPANSGNPVNVTIGPTTTVDCTYSTP